MFQTQKKTLVVVVVAVFHVPQNYAATCSTAAPYLPRIFL